LRNRGIPVHMNKSNGEHYDESSVAEIKARTVINMTLVFMVGLRAQ
jgi:hypothetical protein